MQSRGFRKLLIHEANAVAQPAGDEPGIVEGAFDIRAAERGGRTHSHDLHPKIIRSPPSDLGRSFDRDDGEDPGKTASSEPRINPGSDESRVVMNECVLKPVASLRL